MDQTKARQLIIPLVHKRIVFGHQSVGADIVNGVEEIAKIADGPLNIVETRTPGAAAGLYHFKVGRNRDPLGKLEDFERALTDDSMRGIDMALVKLCYVDVEADTDAAQLASQYLQAIDRIRARLPETRVIAVTCPLRTVQSGMKARIKRAVGVAPHGYEANARRGAFNEVLRARADSRELFDLAAFEADDDGDPTQVDFKGARIAALTPRFTYDGGHLNSVGKLHVARALLEFLAR